MDYQEAEEELMLAEQACSRASTISCTYPAKRHAT